MPNYKIKTRLHELRKERNMQQSELAELVGVRRETIGNLENGKYNPSLKLAAAAMTHPDKLTVFIAIKYSRLKVTHTFQAFKAGDRA